jgi:hypothetical protein
MYFVTKKCVCDVQTFWRERKRVHKRKQLKVRGAGESGVARRPETEVVLGCQRLRKPSAVVGVWWAGSVAVCDIRPRHRIFLL